MDACACSRVSMADYNGYLVTCAGLDSSLLATRFLIPKRSKECFAPFSLIRRVPRQQILVTLRGRGQNRPTTSTRPCGAVHCSPNLSVASGVLNFGCCSTAARS